MIEHLEHDINWTGGIGRPAGIFWIAGRCVMAAHDSPMEERLLARGAILVGTLRFDADPIETVHHTGTVERLTTHAAMREFRVALPN